MQIISGDIKTVAIVGSGVAGLTAARFLQNAGLTCEIFEKSQKLGGVWAAGYHAFGLQVPRSFYEFPDYPMPENYPNLPSGEQVWAYLEDYAHHFQIFDKIRFNCIVKQLEPIPENRWILHYANQDTGETIQKEFDFVVVSTGLYSNPYIPPIPNREVFSGKVLHSSGYQSPDLLKDRRVVVVGFGKSALDIATDAVQWATDVTLVFRNAYWPVPLRVLGLIDFRVIFLNRLIGGFLPLYQRPYKWEKNFHKYFSGLIWGFWRFVELLLQLQYSLKESNSTPSHPAESGVFAHGFIPRNETYKLMRQGAIQVQRTTIEQFTPSGLDLANGVHLESDVVIFGTGWQPNYSFLPAAFQSTVDEDGAYLYRHIIHPDLPGLAFIGWASTFSNSLTTHLEVIWLIHLLKGKIQLPEPEVMWQEISQMKHWKRSFIPPVAGRGSLLQTHMWHYHDELLGDLSINPYRKSNPITEWLQDYRPADYRDLVTEMASLTWESQVKP
ncbi:NAD(P)-binding domain-containing protein [Leptolyngbya sp. ST-U4]|uniref:flavin-containing monooxygenase n=2 Tax=unclassified Leptolyngbya TaxID=2650499 RepID=UPI0019922086|nr:NAD(P)-binding domain-containing protein [Cyanobacteria bacterium FACHB-502]